MNDEIERLFQQQLVAWPMLVRGVEGLAHAKTRSVHIDWFDIVIRHIPHRVTSTTAAVDPESIQMRPCFLCAGNLSPDQKGIPFGPDYILYCNPFPIVEHHLTIVHRHHRSQRIAGEFGTLLDLAKVLEGYFVIYNGPECGASAPDHLHFQAGSRELFPIEADTVNVPGPAVPRYARNVLLFRSFDRSYMIEKMSHAVELLSSVTGKTTEPLINIAVFNDAKSGWTGYMFPRGKHRPQVFHSGELIVSPASIDLCGIFVVPVEKDFAKISAEDIAAIFREVTLPDNQFEEIVERLESTR
jgi:hypothetical protein